MNVFNQTLLVLESSSVSSSISPRNGESNRTRTNTPKLGLGLDVSSFPFLDFLLKFVHLFLEFLFTLRAAGSRLRHIPHFLEIQLPLPTYFIRQVPLLAELLL